MSAGEAAWRGLGVGAAHGGLAKLRIEAERSAAPNGRVATWHPPVEVMFNPDELAFARKVVWKRVPVAGHGPQVQAMDLAYRSVAPGTLRLTLFFDSYEPATSLDGVRNFLVPTNPFARAGGPLSAVTGGPSATDVRRHTDRVLELARVASVLHRPPRCRLRWGGLRFVFQGVLTAYTEKLTMFLPDGTPVRATVDCRFTEYATDITDQRRRELQSSDVAKRVVVGPTDTLQSIAADEYDDPGMWRVIARANGIANPRAVAPGTVLILPSVPT